MVKTLISVIAAILIFAGCAVAENYMIENSFGEFDERLALLYDKTLDESATVDDVLGVQKLWVDKKEILHVAIPHVEIKEIDLWLSETVRLVEQQKFLDAAQKIEVARELCEQIPRTFKVRIENIF